MVEGGARTWKSVWLAFEPSAWSTVNVAADFLDGSASEDSIMSSGSTREIIAVSWVPIYRVHPATHCTTFENTMR